MGLLIWLEVILMNNIKQKSEYIVLNENNINSLLDNKSYIIDKNLLMDNICINIPDGYNLSFYLIDYDSNKLDITFNQNNDSNLIFNFSIINNDKSSYKIINNINGSNNKTVIKGRIYNNINADTMCDISGDIKKNTLNNDYTEDVRGLNLYSNNLIIKPNLIVSTDEVIANHMVTIGNFEKSKINYLKQKGLSDENVKKLLLNNFLYEIFPKDLINNNDD